MKKVITSVLLITVGIFSVKAATPAADPTKATINDQLVITLPVDLPLAEWYVLDATSMNFISQEVMNQFCTNFSDNNITMTGNFAEKKISMQVLPLRDSAGNMWDAARWNDYFTKRAPKMVKYMETMNK